MTSYSNDWSMEQAASVLGSAFIHIFNQAKDCVNVPCGPHVVHLGDNQDEVKSCPSQQDCLQGRQRNCMVYCWKARLWKRITRER